MVNKTKDLDEAARFKHAEAQDSRGFEFLLALRQQLPLI